MTESSPASLCESLLWHCANTVLKFGNSFKLLIYMWLQQTALHGSCPVIQGEKWVATKWIRDTPMFWQLELHQKRILTNPSSINSATSMKQEARCTISRDCICCFIWTWFNGLGLQEAGTIAVVHHIYELQAMQCAPSIWGPIFADWGGLFTSETQLWAHEE